MSTDQLPPPKALPFRRDINGLRALSVALVVFYHTHVSGTAGGFVGVDIFFVISGFLMTQIITSGLVAHEFSYGRFLRARAARIWPGLGAMTAGLLVFGSLALPPSDLLQISRQALWPLLFWSNQDFRAHAGYDTQGADGHWFLQTWSLSVEWQFYLLFPLLLMWLYRLVSRLRASPRGRAWAVRGALLTLAAGSLGWYVFKSSVDPAGAFFPLPARAWELLAGSLIVPAPGARRPSSHFARVAASYGGVILILLSVLWLGHAHIDPVGAGWYSVPPIIGAMLVLWAGADATLALGNRLAQAVGRWSYSIYLWHWPLVVLCAMDALIETRPVTGTAIIVLGSLALGAMSYRWIESPRWAYKPLALMCAAALGAGIGYLSHGLEWRMPALPNASLAKPALESDYFPDACSNFQKTIDQVRPCVIDRGTRRVLVIGDSLAESLWPWFRSHGEASVDFLTESECPPVPHLDRLQAGFHCMDYAALAWHTAAQSRYDTVIVSGNWELIGQLGPDYCYQDATGACRIVRGDEKTRRVLAELRAAIDSVLAAGNRVVFLQNSPEARVPVPQRLERERYWFGAPRLTISMADVTARNAWIDGLLASLAGSPGFYLLSFRPLLCDGQSCRTWDASLARPVYVDERHFDPGWIEARGGIFAPFVGAGPPPAVDRRR